MQVKITIKNYRCFSDSNPARIIIRNGFTAFIGINNSGKSSLLKFFYEFSNMFSSLSDWTKLRNTLNGESQSFIFPVEVLDRQEVFFNKNNRDLEVDFEFIQEANDIKEERLQFLERIVLVVPRNNTYKAYIYHKNNILNSSSYIFNLDKTGLLAEMKESNNMHVKLDINHIFETFNDLSKTFYIGPFRNAISVLPKLDSTLMEQVDQNYLKYYDIKVGRDFIRQWAESKIGSDKSRNLAIIQLTEDIKRIFDIDKLEINASNDYQSLKLFIEEQVYNLSEVGSGLAQFILVMANLLVEKPVYILIDEPELNLHPMLQIDFLTTLGKYATKGVLFATHNIGLARVSAEYIYTVRKSVEGSLVNDYEKNPSLPELLGELSFSTYKEFGFDKILLVEGSTEIKTIQQFLRKYRQDHNIVLLPLGGSALINGSSKYELEEIKRISENIFALIDSEKASLNQNLSKEREDFLNNCEEIGIDCHILEYRAIENYFTDEAIKKAKGDNFQALQSYQLLKDMKNGWNKSENWRIAKEMSKEDLEKTDLGEFLKRLCNKC